MNLILFQRILSQRANYLSKSIDKLQNRDEKCQIPDTDGFLTKATQSIKATLANAFIDQLNNSRQRRQANQSIKLKSSSFHLYKLQVKPISLVEIYDEWVRRYQLYPLNRSLQFLMRLYFNVSVHLATSMITIRIKWRKLLKNTFKFESFL